VRPSRALAAVLGVLAFATGACSTGASGPGRAVVSPDGGDAAGLPDAAMSVSGVDAAKNCIVGASKLGDCVL
jgi:hypothetical protein